MPSGWAGQDGGSRGRKSSLCIFFFSWVGNCKKDHTEHRGLDLAPPRSKAMILAQDLVWCGMCVSYILLAWLASLGSAEV